MSDKFGTNAMQASLRVLRETPGLVGDRSVRRSILEVQRAGCAMHQDHEAERLYAAEMLAASQREAICLMLDLEVVQGNEAHLAHCIAAAEEKLAAAEEKLVAAGKTLLTFQRETSYWQAELQTMQNFSARQTDAIERLKALAEQSGASRDIIDKAGKTW